MRPNRQLPLLVAGALLLSTLERAVIIFELPSQTTPLFKAVVLIAVCVAASPFLRSRLDARRVRAARPRPVEVVR